MSTSRQAAHRFRVYSGLRSAHLERFHVLEPATVLFASANYDFDEALLDGLDVQQYAGTGDLFRRLVRSDVEVLEVNEPLMLSAVKHALVAVAAVRLGGLLRRRRATIVTYAIENLDPFATSSPRLRSPVRRRVYGWAVALLVRHIDRLAFGTPGAEQLYQPLLGTFRGETEQIPALPTPCEGCEAEPVSATGSDVMFLGAFDDRKGLPQLLDAWPEVVRRVPGARLRIVGKGPHQVLAQEFVQTHAEASLSVDPPRQQIHEALRASKVVVLLSQPTATWREQVGLPIVEGLAHGCEIVATTETGIAGWLRGHGHRVLPPTASRDQVAEAIAEACSSTRTAEDVLADLPQVDGRLAADRWMFNPGPARGATARRTAPR